LTLAIGGVVGLVATFLPKRLAVVGLGLEFVARIALGIANLAYALAVTLSRGFFNAEFTILTYYGIALLMMLGAYQITRWLRMQRTAVDGVLAITHPEEGAS
jgi:hypothetical protein